MDPLARRCVRRPAPHGGRPVVGRLPRLVLAPLCAAALLGCSAGTADSAAPAATSAPSPTTEGTASPAAPAGPTPTAAAGPTASPAPQAQVIDVTFAGGEITGVEPRVEVGLGEQVLLRVTSDVPEEIHVHGYDRYLDVPAGGTGEVSFVADIPGAFEVELHDAGRPIFQLRVA